VKVCLSDSSTASSFAIILGSSTPINLFGFLVVVVIDADVDVVVTAALINDSKLSCNFDWLSLCRGYSLVSFQCFSLAARKLCCQKMQFKLLVLFAVFTHKKVSSRFCWISTLKLNFL
jgi:hypothetical protein